MRSRSRRCCVAQSRISWMASGSFAVSASMTVAAPSPYGHAVESSRPQLEPWLPWVPFNVDLDSSGRYAEASASDWDAARATRFAIRDRSTRRLLGVIGLESFAHLHESVELGYWLRIDSWGKGFMTEAAQGVLDWAFGPVNARSRRREGVPCGYRPRG